MRMQLTRDFYIPRDVADLNEIKDECGTVIYTFTNSRGKPAAMGFAGKAAKPAFHYYFGDEDKRAKHCSLWVQGIKGRQAATAARRAERSAPHSLKEGDIMVSSWGYSMTFVDFYVVTKTTANSVTLEEIGSKIVSGDGWGGRVTADPSVRTGKLQTVRVDGKDNSCKVGRSHYASKWDGTDRYFNRCD